ncbi:hypothetical protein [Caulobacter sp. 17J65-9]|uniref:hypothetical protein n=1 Tax=Caulobacter sp. 17J65-9 TaxID=2709382 RepID=UPI0013C95F95|nr:hypothetical protein [Caulobacter sp. 17J65-9]NEX94550.1 hypothetical protein [Caulobacter sp. 17J65-9]
MRIALICGAAALALAGCGKPEASKTEKPATVVATAPEPGSEALEGFTTQPGLELFGYYMPQTEIQVVQWRLDHLHLGSPTEFEDWAAGRRTAAYAPVMMEFDDTKSPKKINELGQDVYAVRERVLPDAWRVTESEVAFVDNHPRLGKVSFQGALDRKALARAKAGDGEAVVLTGTLTVGEAVFTDLKFTWFGGD